MPSLSDNDVKIKFSTTADGKGIDDVDKGMKSLGGTFNNVSDKAFQFGKVAAVALAATAVAVVSFGVSAVNAYADAEKSQAQLEHAVIGVSHATQEQLVQTQALADALEKKGVLDGDNIKVGLAQLSTFGLSNKAVQGLGGSLADLAVNQFGASASGEQLSDSANMIAKALNGQFGVLEKSGIRFSNAQKNAIQFGTEMQKVDAINEGFAQNLKYTNDVALTTTEGKLAKMKVSFGNVQEAIGGVIANAITPLVTKLSDFVSTDQFQAWVTKLTDWLNINLPLAITYLTDVLWPQLQKVLQDSWPVVQTLWTMFQGLFQFFSDNTWILVGIAGAFGAIKTAMFLAGAIEAFTGVIGAAKLAFGGLAAMVSVPMIMPALTIAAALAAIALVLEAINSVQRANDALNNARAATANNDKAGADLRTVADKKFAAGAIDQKEKDRLYTVSHYATGTNYAPGGIAIVGENGPELVDMPRGSKVHNTQESNRMATGGNTTSITIGQVILSTADAVREFLGLSDRDSQMVSMNLTPSRGQ